MWLYALVMHHGYRTAVAPVYGYMGLEYRQPDTDTYALAVGLTCALAALLPQRLRAPSDFIQWVVFVLAVAPTMLVSQYTPIIDVSDATKLGLVSAACTLMIRALSRLRPHNLLPRRVSLSGSGWLVTSLIISSVTYIILILTAGISVSYLSFSNVYSVRESFSSATTGVPLFGYLFGLQSNVLNPLFIARGIHYRERSLMILGILGQVLLYTTTGHKAVLLSVVAIAGLAFAVRKRTSLSSTRFICYALAIQAGCLIFDRIAQSGVLTGLIFRRLLIFPGILSAAYVGVFSGAPKTKFSEVIPWADSPYSVSPSYIVGEVFFRSSETNANVSWIGHGYASLGYWGVLIEALVIVLLMWLADDAAKGLPTQIGAMLFVIPAMSLASASVTTTILTHGFAAAVICAWSLPRGDGRFINESSATPARLEQPTKTA